MLLLSYFAFTRPSEYYIHTPHFRTPALMPCAHPHAKIRFVLVFSCTRSLALYLCSLCQEYIDARRPRREAADDSRHRTESTSIASASCASREDGEACETRRSMRPWRALCCGQASAQLEHSSLGGSAAASAAASAAPPSVAAGRAAQPKTGAVR